MTTAQQLVVGVFRNRDQAEQAVNELLQAGFDNQQIRFAGQGTPTGSMLEKIRSLFTGQDTSAGGIYHDLVNMGAPAEDAHYYQSEYEAGRSVVAVTGSERIQEAITILARYGGYGANQRFAQSTAYGQGATAQEPIAEGVDTEYNRRHLPQQGARPLQEPRQTSTINTYYDLVSVLYHALEAEQTSATYVQDAQQSGDQDLIKFFGDVQQDASRQANRAKELIGRTSSGVRSFGSDQPEEHRSPARSGGVLS